MGLVSWWKNRPKPTVCHSVSGLMFGYPCELPYGHAGRHECVTSTTTTNGVETGRTITSWEEGK